MKKLPFAIAALLSAPVFAQMDVQTTRLTHLLPEPNQALFNHMMALPTGTEVFVWDYKNDYYRVRYNQQEYYIFYPYFSEIQYALDLKDQVETGGANIHGIKELPKQKVKFVSPGGGSPYRTIHTGPRGGRYYINKNGNKTYIKH